jgi:hypothetical protein
MWCQRIYHHVSADSYTWIKVDFYAGTSYFPERYTLPNETAIPFWAGTDRLWLCYFRLLELTNYGE